MLKRTREPPLEKHKGYIILNVFSSVDKRTDESAILSKLTNSRSFNVALIND
jgi:hypothetical protein